MGVIAISPSASAAPAPTELSLGGGNFTLARDASASGDVITLTPDAGTKAGAAFSKNRIDVRETFTVTAELNLGTKTSSGADGIAFVLQPNSSTTLTSGGGIGYDNVTNAFAVEFDTWQNGTELANDHAGLMKNDVELHTEWGVNPVDLGEIEDGQWRKVEFSWLPAAGVTGCAAGEGKFTAKYDRNYDGDLDDAGETLFNAVCIALEGYFAAAGYTTYFGFTAATGGSTNLQQVRTLAAIATPRDNTPPTLNAIPDQTVVLGTGMQTLTITIADDNTSGAQWEVTQSSGDSSIVPTVTTTGYASIAGTTGGTFTLRFTPSLVNLGTSVITLTVLDADGASATRTFNVNVVSNATSRPGSLLTFMPNGADNFAYPQSPLLGETVPLWKNMLVRTGYTFAGWNTKADGTGTSYADQAMFKFSEAFMTLHAQWKLIQTKPTISWATPVAIQEGTALSATQLNALASVPGTYTYAPAATALLAVGKHTLKVTFVPTSPLYETIETTVEIEVLAKAKLTWANPAAIVEGTALSGTQLNATASVPGTFVYSPATGALLPVGKNTLKVTFTPTDTRLSPVTAEVTLDVSAKPVVVVPPTVGEPQPPVVPAPTVVTSKQKVYFAMSSFALNAKAKADLTKLAKKALAAGSSFKVTVVGFTQPTSKDPNFKTLANNRAKAAANFLRSLGVKGSYSITGVGQAPRNVASSRYAEVTVLVQSK